MTSITAALRGPLRKRDSHLWARHPEDWYVEPEWVSARLFAVENFDGGILDPSCGLGRIVNSARAAGLSALGHDIVQRGGVFIGAPRDFLECTGNHPNIVANPPFGIAEKFVSKALELAERKVAMLLPANWVQGAKRSRWLQSTPLRRVYFIAPRPSMPPGPAIEAGVRPGNGTTDYAWFVWLRGYDGAPEIRWLHRDEART